MKEINATLNAAGISPIYLKGTGNLIDGIYDDIGERIIGDIDFLVPEKDFLTTAEYFKSEGYEICFPAYLPYDQMKHYPRLWKEDVAADLEIHRIPVTQKYAAHFSSDIVQQSKKMVTDFPGCYVLSDNHKVTLNFIHSQLSNAGHRLGIVSLRDIYDLHCFSKRVDLQQLAAPYRQKYLAYCDITNKLLGLPISDKQTLSSKVFCRKHDLNLSSPLFSTLNRIEFYNPGRLPDSITVEDLLSNNYKSTPRNKLIADFCKSIGLIEKYGSGIRRIVEYFTEAQLPRPEFRNISDGFMVTIFAKNTDKAIDTGGQIGGLIGGQIGGQMTENQQKILSLINGNNKISRKEIADKIEINESAIQKQLKNLMRLGVIERIGGTRGFWKIN